MHEVAAAIPNPTAPPNAAIRTPVMDGPIMRPACQGIEPSAIALESRSRSMSWGMSAMRLGAAAPPQRWATALRQAEIGERHRGPADLPRHTGEGHVFRAMTEDLEDEPEPVEAVVPPLE